MLIVTYISHDTIKMLEGKISDWIHTNYKSIIYYIHYLTNYYTAYPYYQLSLLYYHYVYKKVETLYKTPISMFHQILNKDTMTDIKFFIFFFLEWYFIS